MIVLDGRLLPDAEARLSPLGDGFMFGSGVFTTLRVRDGRLEFFAEHLARLQADAAALGLAPASASAELRERCAACVRANALGDSGLKIVWFADVGGRTGELILPRPHAYDAAAHARGFRLKTLPCPVRAGRALAAHKTLNYFEHAQAKRAALAAGFDEALWIDAQGRVLEGATSNLFALIDGELRTPPVAHGILPGVARRVVLRLALPWPVRETALTAADLARAQEIFVTNSLLGVMTVRALDERIFPARTDGAAAKANTAFAQEALRTNTLA